MVFWESPELGDRGPGSSSVMVGSVTEEFTHPLWVLVS